MVQWCLNLRCIACTHTHDTHALIHPQVVVRIRPENEAEASSGAPTVARVLDSHVLVFDPTPENIPSFHALNPFKYVTSACTMGHSGIYTHFGGKWMVYTLYAY